MTSSNGKPTTPSAISLTTAVAAAGKNANVWRSHFQVVNLTRPVSLEHPTCLGVLLRLGLVAFVSFLSRFLGLHWL